MKIFNPEMLAESVPSPCVNICVMDKNTSLCKGCYRTIEEIAQWSNATDAIKRVVWRKIHQRFQTSQ